MKKFIIPILAFILVSCSKDKVEETNNINQDLMGKWQYVEYIDDVIELDQNGNPILNLITNGYIIEFKNDGTFLSNEFVEYNGGTYTVIPVNGGNNIRLNYENNTNQMTKYQGIKTIENSNLILTYKSDIQYDFSNSLVLIQRYSPISGISTKN